MKIKIEQVYELVFGNPIEHYPEMTNGQMLDEIIEELEMVVRP